MKCEKIRELFPEYFMGHLDSSAKGKIDTHLSQCDSCKGEFEHIKAIWATLGTIPEEEPSSILRSRFYAMLEVYQQGLHQAEKTVSWRRMLADWMVTGWFRRPAFQFAIALICLLAGLLIGRSMKSSLHQAGEMVQLREELKQMRQMVMLSLLKQPSSSERLRGISLSTHINQPDETLTSALLNTLNSDPNINVRLAAVDALYLFSDSAKIRAELIQSLSKQVSPLVQIALIDLLVGINEKKSLKALRNLIKNQKINQTVKQRAEWGIEQLI